MTVDIDFQPTIVSPTQFAFTVPGHQEWTIRTVRAVANRHAGGIPNRAYTLTVTNSAIVVAAAGAQDAGTEPGQCSVTWADVPASASAAGSDGVVVAPFGRLRIPAGYVITGEIVAPAAADAWISAVCWFDYVNV